MGAADDIRAFAARMRRMGELAPEIAKEAAPGILEAVRANVADGHAPDGEAWAPTKADKRRKRESREAIPGAAAALSVKVTKDNTVRVGVGAPYVFHNYGSVARSLPKRQILPRTADGMPAGVEAALNDAADRVFARKMGGG